MPKLSGYNLFIKDKTIYGDLSFGDKDEEAKAKYNDKAKAETEKPKKTKASKAEKESSDFSSILKQMGVSPHLIPAQCMPKTEKPKKTKTSKAEKESSETEETETKSNKEELIDHIKKEYGDEVKETKAALKAMELKVLQDLATSTLYGTYSKDELVEFILRNQRAKARGFYADEECNWNEETHDWEEDKDDIVYYAQYMKLEENEKIHVRVLDCSMNNLTSLPKLPPNLRILNCAENHLTSLPTLPLTLQKLDCDDNDLTSLPELPSTLQELVCSLNPLTSLLKLKLPPNLQILNCSQSEFLTSLPKLPSTLQELICDGCDLTSLPELPSTLQKLNCDFNQLTSLPKLPSTLRKLYCSDNQLTSLPELPSALEKLNYDGNEIMHDVDTKAELVDYDSEDDE